MVFTLVIARKLDLYLFSCSLSCIQASVESLSRWLALTTSLQPALEVNQQPTNLFCFSLAFLS